jgi:pimeloyl-ACP methyl ester carboxylesterase
MKLFFQKFGQGPSVIILHGLYGCSDNWVSVARKIADRYTVFLVDQRNHGKSPHHPLHTYPSMVSDLEEFIQSENIEKPLILGHSMGGKTAMLFAATHPDKLSGLIVVDIGPGGYANIDSYSPLAIAQLNIMSSMLSVDFEKHTTRGEIENELARTITNWNVRQFIMKNVQRNADHTFSWKLNLEALSKALPEIMGPVPPDKAQVGKAIYGFPVYFIKGERSDYISPDQEVLIRKYFPDAKLENISDAGHWVHAEQPVKFLERLEEILKTIPYH